ncbi:Gfo/Idh/MocA family oxidoreductase [Sinomonas sp. ASV486]|uniref:Gfo/Idh/MocA family protein n=1 Tax=Sinomonas sp. ASV486 TaxID=3051170 RepID=UPI0027DB9526|nr:Gfo/Idh/MocA family oxidoreductase [Sinomonas sp. ASV486]MDQ4489420.1 Gfo/Idh/MocA family oxidoreductase [Sinomonas sp. ASV486]
MTSPAKYRVGIVGCGAISRNHLEAFAAIPEATVVAVCDVDADRARATASQWGIEHAYGSVEELLAAGIDLVSVCTPHPTHEEVVLAAAAAGAHVLCEKPIAIDLASAERMVAACDAAGVRLGVFFQRRFWPAAQRLRAAIDDGTIGRPILGHASVVLHRDPSYYSAAAWRGTWATDGGGVLMTQAIHYIDLLQWLMGEVVEVHGHIATFTHSIEVEDTAAAVIRFASGAIATLSATTAATPSLGVSIRITGETGATAELSEFPEGTDGRVTLFARGGTIESEPVQPAGVDPNVDLATINGQLIPHHTAQIRDFVSALSANDGEGREPAITGPDATAALRILLAVYESSRTGRPVTFSREDALA